MDPFSFFEKQSSLGSPTWTSNNHFPFYCRPRFDFSDALDIRSFNEDHPDFSLDLFEPPLTQSLNIHQISTPSNPDKVLNNDNLDSDSVRELHIMHKENQDVNRPVTRVQKKRPRPVKTNNNILKGFADLVNKSSAFWMNKLAAQAPTKDPVRPNDRSQEPYDEECDSDDTKPTGSCPQEVLLNSMSHYRKALEVLEIESLSSNEVAEFLIQQDQFSDDDQENRPNNIIIGKKIQKLFKKTDEPKARRVKEEFTHDEDFEILRLYRVYGHNWEKISQFLPLKRASAIRNRFHSTIRGKMEEMLKELDVSEGRDSEVTSESSSQFPETLGWSKVQFGKEENEVQRSEEDILDSYFNKDNLEDLGRSLLENDHILERINLVDSMESTSDNSVSYGYSRILDEDVIGERSREEKSKKEAMEILNGRISLLTSLYNQTKIEIMRIQRNKVCERSVGTEGI